MAWPHAERFSRFRIRGRWDDRDSLEITSVSVQGIRDGSRRYLTAAAQGGGSLGRGILNGLSGLFDRPDPNAPATSPGGPGQNR